MPERLEGKVALVVGAGGRIGRAIARVLGRDGARLALADVAPKSLDEPASVVDGVEMVERCDVADSASVRALFSAVDRQMGRLDVLVNTAGIAGRGAIDEVDEGLWDRVIAVNLSGVFWACRCAVPLLRRAGGGTIVNIASIAGLREQSGSVVYSASKGGVVMLSRTLAADLVRERIRVYAVCPTAVETPLLGDALTGDARREVERGQPSGRLIQPEEVAEVVGALASGIGFPYAPEPFVV
jgi:meso-butanediol dehydrogenase/(S,S)-butanediol dehydrogenase/diacetyl reductase